MQQAAYVEAALHRLQATDGAPWQHHPEAGALPGRLCRAWSCCRAWEMQGPHLQRDGRLAAALDEQAGCSRVRAPDVGHQAHHALVLFALPAGAQGAQTAGNCFSACRV